MMSSGRSALTLHICLCAEILSHVIRESGDIRGIVVHDEEFRVSQYADDTTLLLDEDLQSLVSVIRILKWFKTDSGLDNAKKKTKVVKRGVKRQQHTLAGRIRIQMGIQYNMKKLNEITDLTI